MMHAKFCVKRPNGVGVYFFETQTEDRQTHRQNENSCPFSGLGPFTVVNYSVGIKAAHWAGTHTVILNIILRLTTHCNT